MQITSTAGKDSWPFLLLLFMIITFQAGICKGQDAYYMCNRAKYTQGSELEMNLNRVLYNLSEDTSQTGFNISVYGQSPNRIYGLLQCRGDATLNDCSDCSQQTTSSIRTDCNNAVGGRVWSDLCYLRYENYSFVGQLDMDGWNVQGTQNASSPDIFKAALGKLFNKLSAKITSGSARRKRYAWGSTTDSSFQRIFALVQCWSDISIDNCTKCLSVTINSILKETVARDGQGFRGSCIARYGSERFFSDSPPPPPTKTPPPPRPAETPSPPSKLPSKNSSNNP